MASAHPDCPASDHWDGRRFQNPGGHVDRGLLDVLRWKMTARPTAWPRWVEVPEAAVPIPSADEVAVQWINHATFLLRSRHWAILTDPHWGDRAGPFGLGPRRVHAPAVAIEALPPVDVVLLSHDHYDHCDLGTLRRLALRSTHTILVAPLGFASLARRAGFTGTRFVVLDWWQTTTPVADVEIMATPARHWSNRLSGGRNRRLWCGYGLRMGTAVVYFAGDTAADPGMFRAVSQRLGAPDLALLPIGAYEPRWFMAAQHCDPVEAVEIHRQLRARRSVGMHWGTFRLTDEGREAPVHGLAAAVQAAGLAPDEFTAPSAGFTIVLPLHARV